MDEQLDSQSMQQVIEADILEKCGQAPNGAISMANLLGSMQYNPAMPGLYLMAATNLCSQGKVRLQQMGSQEEASTLDTLIITLIN